MVTVLKIIGSYHDRGGITFADTLKERVLEGVDERAVQAYFGSLDVDGLIERRRTEHGRRYFLTEMGLEEYRSLPER